jgi:hypothetical protein
MVRGYSVLANAGKRVDFYSIAKVTRKNGLSIGRSPNRAWLQHPGYGIFNPRVSNDGRWVSFNARANRLAPARVLVAPVDELGVAPERDWTTTDLKTCVSRPLVAFVKPKPTSSPITCIVPPRERESCSMAPTAVQTILQGEP